MRPGRRFFLRAVVVALLLACLGGAWWLASPMFVRGETASPRVQQDAWLAAAERVRATHAKPAEGVADSGGLATHASASADRASASTTSPDMALCGDAERPKSEWRQQADGTSVQDQTKAPGPRYLAGMAKVDAFLRAAGDPPGRATADWLNAGSMRTPAGRLDALSRQAVEDNNPRVYGLAYRACLKSEAMPPSCAALDPRAWAALDPGNGVPWAYALARAVATSDPAARHEALVKMAQADRFGDNGSTLPALVTAYPASSETEMAVVLDMADQVFQGEGFDGTPSQPLLEACRNRGNGSAEVLRECEAIVGVMFNRSDSRLLRATAGDLQIAIDGDKTLRRRFGDEVWRAARAWSADMSQPPCTQARNFMATVRHRAAVGEVQEMFDAMRAASAP